MKTLIAIALAFGLAAPASAITRAEAADHLKRGVPQEVVLEIANQGCQLGDRASCEVLTVFETAYCNRGVAAACVWLDQQKIRQRQANTRRVLGVIGAFGDAMVASQERANNAFRPSVLCRQTALGVQCQ